MILLTLVLPKEDDKGCTGSKLTAGIRICPACGVIESDRGETVVETLSSGTACGKILDECFYNAKVITVVIPHIEGVWIKEILNKKVRKLHDERQEYAKFTRTLSGSGNAVVEGRGCMSKLTAEFIENMANWSVGKENE
jgi:hypothetical protein